MPRFVILEHDHPILHWDLMLESGSVLRTWRLTAPPAAGELCAAEPLGDHRLAYLDYEGPVSGGRGSVKRWDSGSYECTAHEGEMILEMQGGRVQGRACLRPEGAAWLFQFDGRA
jgi:hypothetical protein